MALKFSKLVDIKNDRQIRKEMDFDWWYHMKQGLLLALRDRGTLDAMQYRIAKEQLQQRAQRAHKWVEEDMK